MRAVYRHELSSHYTDLTAYVFTAFLLLFAGIFTHVINLGNSVANFEYVLLNMSFTFMIIVPILTMKTISGERKAKTDNLLYSLPISMTDVVLGKYMALLTVFIVPVVIIGIYPLVLKNYGEVNLAASYSALIGFFFLGAALMAVGMYISSLTESQAAAAGICFGVMLLNYFSSTIASYISSETLSDILKNISLFSRFDDMSEGVLDIGNIVFFISVAAVFVFLTVRRTDNRRWSE